MGLSYFWINLQTIESTFRKHFLLKKFLNLIKMSRLEKGCIEDDNLTDFQSDEEPDIEGPISLTKKGRERKPLDRNSDQYKALCERVKKANAVRKQNALARREANGKAEEERQKKAQEQVEKQRLFEEAKERILEFELEKAAKTQAKKIVRNSILTTVSNMATIKDIQKVEKATEKRVMKRVQVEQPVEVKKQEKAPTMTPIQKEKQPAVEPQQTQQQFYRGLGGLSAVQRPVASTLTGPQALRAFGF
jgi:hypothetical protein